MEASDNPSSVHLVIFTPTNLDELCPCPTVLSTAITTILFVTCVWVANAHVWPGTTSIHNSLLHIHTVLIEGTIINLNMEMLNVLVFVKRSCCDQKLSIRQHSAYFFLR